MQSPKHDLEMMQLAFAKLEENNVPPGPDGKYTVFAQPGSIAAEIDAPSSKLSAAETIKRLPRKVRRKILRAQKRALDHYSKTGEIVIPRHL